MDTTRTVYIDRHHATERNISYVYDLQGGIAVPEGARVMVDNVSLPTPFLTGHQENKWTFLKAYKPGTVLDIRDKDYSFSLDGGPRKVLCMATFE